LCSSLCSSLCISWLVFPHPVGWFSPNWMAGFPPACRLDGGFSPNWMAHGIFQEGEKAYHIYSVVEFCWHAAPVFLDDTGLAQLVARAFLLIPSEPGFILPFITGLVEPPVRVFRSF